MHSKQIRQTFLDFFAKKGHIIVPSSSLIPADSSVLLTTAGMQQFVSYLSDEVESPYQRACSAQKCFRTGDIDEVGDETHHTFFEMLGNWSFGNQRSEVGSQKSEVGYWKKEAIDYALELLTDIYRLSINRIWPTVFKGEKGISGDEEVINLWIKAGIPKERIKEFGMKDNFWGPTTETGPCGPCSEIHYDRGEKFKKGQCSIKSCGPNCECGRFIEIWNLVFMEYNKRKIPNSKLQITNKFQISNSKICSELVEGFKKEFEYVPLPQKNIDTGIGFERLVAILQNKPSAYETDLFEPIIKKIRFPEMSSSTENSPLLRGTRGVLNKKEDNPLTPFKKGECNQRTRRIIADHIRGACFLIADKVLPSKEDQGYVLRRILRKTIVKLRSLDSIDNEWSSEAIRQPAKSFAPAQSLGRSPRFATPLAQSLGRSPRFATLLVDLIIKVIETYQDIYPELKKAKNDILTVIQNEEEKFSRTLKKGLKEFEKKIKKLKSYPGLAPRSGAGKLQVKKLTGQDTFHLFDTYGFPLELTKEMAKEKGIEVDEQGFKKAFEKHQEISRIGAEKKFGGHGIDQVKTQNTKHKSIKLHTATHLLHQALRDVLGDHVKQMGSDINPERLRFDFSHPQKLTDQEKKKTEKIVNQKIKEDLPINMEEMNYEEAINSEALAFFREKYPKIVKVYSIGDYSKEICAGPHVEKTGNIGEFKISSEKSSSAGVRRIKGLLLNHSCS